MRKHPSDKQAQSETDDLMIFMLAPFVLIMGEETEFALQEILMSDISSLQGPSQPILPPSHKICRPVSRKVQGK
eukprot:749847-Hanusia_phi.AAC.2